MTKNKTKKHKKDKNKKDKNKKTIMTKKAQHTDAALRNGRSDY